MEWEKRLCVYVGEEKGEWEGREKLKHAYTETETGNAGGVMIKIVKKLPVILGNMRNYENQLYCSYTLYI